MYHWYTLSYARHMASDKLYDELNDLVDTFVETYIGKYGRPTITSSSWKKADRIVPLAITDDKRFVPFLNDAVVTLEKTLLAKGIIKESDTDLLSIRDDIVAAIHQCIYRCTLQ